MYSEEFGCLQIIPSKTSSLKGIKFEARTQKHNLNLTFFLFFNLKNRQEIL